ncbi:hypothetical protein F5884DRAFT_752480 [Xylogone sp. PMI_703]|nr:hypothetical protein F5884DRAFT_752480 [Xylogone sp. PMI_703]
MAFYSQLSFITFVLLLLSPTRAWIASEYVGNATDAAGGFTFTQSGVVIPTGSVSILSTGTTTQLGGDVTIVQLFIAGINPLATPASSPGNDIVSGLETSVVYYAPATITQPPHCSKTHFSYGMKNSSQLALVITGLSYHPMFSPLLINLPTSSSTAYMSTSFYVNADGQVTSSSSWSQKDIYLPSGLVIPDIDATTVGLLAGCEDPRGCYTAGTQAIFGTGLGCPPVSGRNYGITNAGTGAPKSSSSTTTGGASAAGGGASTTSPS